MELQVMILDDEYIILDGLCSFPWSDYGYRISATARNGLEGLEKLEQAKPDLILTDVKMPGMDGLDFAEKAHEIYPNAVIVIRQDMTVLPTLRKQSALVWKNIFSNRWTMMS